MLNSRLNPPMFALVLALSGLLDGCFFKRTPRSFTPPPPQTQPQVTAKPPVVASEPPMIEGNPSETLPSAAATIPEIPAPTPPKPQPRNPTIISPPKPPVATPPTEQPPPAPRLGPMLSPDDVRQYNRAIDESLTRVRRILDSLSHKSLNPKQQEDLGRITTFQKQAEQARDAQDLLTAKNLAERADTLAQDLQTRIP